MVLVALEIRETVLLFVVRFDAIVVATFRFRGYYEVRHSINTINTINAINTIDTINTTNTTTAGLSIV